MNKQASKALAIIRMMVLLASSIMFISVAHGDPKLYVRGHYPPGTVYTQYDLERLVGKSFTTPAYLVGDYRIMQRLDPDTGVCFFTCDVPSLIKQGTFGGFNIVIISVRFFNNAPNLLASPFAVNGMNFGVDDPLVLKNVERSSTGEIKVTAESWSAPTEYSHSQ